MRCLYCGKELAFFKRLRGGEFCSDTHRQQYQDDYTKLALNRLLQTNAAGESEEPNPPAAPKAKEPGGIDGRRISEIESPALRRREKQVREDSVPASKSNGPAHNGPKPVAIALGPVAAVEPVKADDKVPAPLSGRVKFSPVSVRLSPPGMSRPAVDLSCSAAPALPRIQNAPQDERAGPVSAGRLALEPPDQVDFSAVPRERALEVRDFVRSIPLTEIRVSPAGETGLAHSEQRAQLLWDFFAPYATPRLWSEPDRAFAGPEVTLGDLGRLDFGTTGWVDTGADPEPRTEENRPAPAPEPPEAIRIDSARIKPLDFGPVRPAPAHYEPVHIEPVFIEGISRQSELAPESALQAQQAPIAEQPAATAAEQRVAKAAEQPAATAPPVPNPVTKPLPLTLHGLAPAAARPVQVFSSGLSRAVEIQSPRQNSLPLRPMMILGAFDAEASAAAERTARASRGAEKQEVRAANGKPRKPDTRVLSLHLKEEDRKEQGKSGEPAKPEVKNREVPKEPAKKEEVKLQPAAKKDSPKPKPSHSGIFDLTEREPVPPAASEPDLLGLPQLSLESEGNFWTRLPAAMRIGAVAAVLAVAGSGIFLLSRGSSAPKPKNPAPVVQSPVVEAGPALAADAGWLTDWFADAAVNGPARHVDVLRGSLTLRDYRLDFEGQIEQGGIGWVFRANNRKNFYVEKIAIVKPGLEPEIALVRFAVIDGQEQARQQIPLPLKVHLDTLFKVRMEAFGHRFTTWVQDEKVDEWEDARIEAGGIGLYYDAGESAKLRGTIHVVPLKAR